MVMARGWESKSVEAQQAEAREEISPRKPRLTVQQAENLRELEGLRLSRVRVLQQIEACTDPRYREILEKSLTALNRQLTELERTAGSSA